MGVGSGGIESSEFLYDVDLVSTPHSAISSEHHPFSVYKTSVVCFEVDLNWITALNVVLSKYAQEVE